MGVDVRGITADSRAVQPGFMFAALPGARSDGRQFIGDAVARGAVAVLAPEGTLWPPGVPPRPLLIDPAPRMRLAKIAAELAGRMPEKLVAVTGTNGKTSTVDFLRQILSLSGREAASLGTLGVVAKGVDPADSLTTPDPVTLANTLSMLAAKGVTHAALEASSHGIEQSHSVARPFG
jgi:UDP-N-acetylmuramoyl-L-alanyl-D-glutamate--2,6-diaminopimelate ligase